MYLIKYSRLQFWKIDGIAFAISQEDKELWMFGTKVIKEDNMKKGVLVVLCTAVLFMTLAPAMSHAWVRGGHHGHWGAGHYRGGPGLGVAGAAVGGVIVGAVIGSALASPAYAAPAPRVVYAYPPPPPRGYYHYAPPPGAYVYPY
jgi:hypothetical protein